VKRGWGSADSGGSERTEATRRRELRGGREGMIGGWMAGGEEWGGKGAMAVEGGGGRMMGDEVERNLESGLVKKEGGG